jgi:hypothetical protein
MNPGLLTEFNDWTDRLLIEHAGTKAVAYHFNLYEHEESFAMQLVGTSVFDVSDDDWPCHEVFSSGEELFHLPHAMVGDQWEKGLEAAKSLVHNYLKQGNHALLLNASLGVGVGFVDGDINLVS